MVSVGLLGATGTVGQKFIALLAAHPLFEITEIAASERSAGHHYRDACRWREPLSLPSHIADMTVKRAGDPMTPKILFSGLDSSVAGGIEKGYAESGHLVISNAKNHRMGAQIPLVIPEINSDHLELIAHQSSSGAIVTNSNCSTMFLAMVLAPLHRTFGIDSVQVVTLQAISGAGWPGVPSLDILGNVIPFIEGEEEKMEIESQKILGRLESDLIIPAPIKISAQCTRVPVYNGHTEAVSIRWIDTPPSPEEIETALHNFRGEPQAAKLPSAPECPIIVTKDAARPQPRLDIEKENGMAAIVGRIRPCTVLDTKMIILGHNTIRGAAGAAILNAEMMHHKGLL